MRILSVGLLAGTLLLSATSGAIAQTEEEKAMAQSVAQSLQESGRLKNYEVGVKYKEGVAWLLGTVTSERQKNIAQQLAETSPGINRVVNKLQIVPSAERLAAGEGDVTMAVTPVSGRSEQSMATRPRQARPAQTRSVSARRLGPMPQAASTPTRPIRIAANAGVVNAGPIAAGSMGGPMPVAMSQQGMARHVSYDHPSMPGYAWPSYAAYPNYAALTYPQQYSASAWPYIGPFYPYPQVPLGWRKVTLEWDDGWWFLDFNE